MNISKCYIKTFFFSPKRRFASTPLLSSPKSNYKHWDIMTKNTWPIGYLKSFNKKHLKFLKILNICYTITFLYETLTFYKLNYNLKYERSRLGHGIYPLYLLSAGKNSSLARPLNYAFAFLKGGSTWVESQTHFKNHSIYCWFSLCLYFHLVS